MTKLMPLLLTGLGLLWGQDPAFTLGLSVNGAAVRVRQGVPLMAECISAPPSSSAETFCPIAACTSAGPARKSPLPSVMRT